MEPRGRYSQEYAQFLCDRFYRRYKETAFLLVKCIVDGCENTFGIRANTPDDKYDIFRETFRCRNCERNSSSDDEQTE